ncbi:MAG: AraC family transcriptional regulator [Eubacteriales bacterium]|nr:AraC family transcriptional regulator [Eubacteriales bacterium]
MEEWNKSLWSYLLAFSSIIILVVLILGTYLYQFYYRTIYRDFESANLQYLSSAAVQHENSVRMLEDIMSQLSLERADVEFILQEQPEKSFDLKDMLRQFNSVSQFFDRIFFFYHGDRFLYNESTSAELGRFVESGLLLEHMTTEQLKYELLRETAGMSVLPEQKVSGFYTERGGAVLKRAVTYLLPMEPGRTSTGLFLVGEEYYDRLFDSRGERRRTGMIFQGEPVVSRGTDMEETEGYGDKILRAIADGRAEGQTKIRLGQESCLLSWQRGESGLIYYTVQPLSVFQKKIWSGQWGILLVLLLCSVPTSLVFWRLSRSLSVRVKSINELLGAQTGYDLQDMEDGVRALVERRRESSEETLMLRRTRFVSRFVRGSFADREEFLTEAGKVGLLANRAYYAVALMGDPESSSEGEAHDRMLGALAQRAGVDGYGIQLTGSSQSLYAVFGDSVQELRGAMEDLFVIGKNSFEAFVMAVSDFHRDYARASDAYLEADSAYATRLLVDNGRILYYRDVRLGEQPAVLSDSYLQRLRHAIKTGNRMEMKLIVGELCDELRSSGQSLLTFRILCNDIIHMLLAEGVSDPAGFENIYNVFSLSQCLTIGDFHDMLLEICGGLLESAARVKAAAGGQDFVEQALGYMKEHYREPELNMSFLAEQLGVSSVTLAVKFKNAMEISPSDYLAILRMEKAKALLKETKLQVKEVSAAVGYEDTRVFLRRFKKYTGKTPGQFRDEG